ncbi:hypothetical protein F5Y19DRAFT_478677 [Xylariaceae sp. FL1651]|nr:hypothetical protein F5Y19DRAFT_478677 [Xylariaceae sp. FL1651]
MSTIPPRGGTKVTLGKDAPIKKEGPGPVPPDSLAAESQAFREVNEVDEQQISRPQEGRASAPPRAPGTSTSHSKGTNTEGTGAKNVGTAPTYVLNQYIRYPGGPHGKDIKEDDGLSSEDKAKNASFTADIGSKDDPSLLVEQNMRVRNTAVPGAVPGSSGRGNVIDEKTTYDMPGTE